MANVIREERMNDHFLKLHLDNGKVRHLFTAADGPDADPHDHPWGFTSTIQRGGYVEEVFDLNNPSARPHVFERREGDTFRNGAGTIHRIVRLLSDECETEIEPGPAERTPGFYQFRDGEVWHRLWHDPEFTRIA